MPDCVHKSYRLQDTALYKMLASGFSLRSYCLVFLVDPKSNFNMFMTALLQM